MNKRLDKHIGQKVAEKRGLQWALTSFAEASWGMDEIDAHGNEESEES